MPLLVILSLLGLALSVPCSADKWAVIVGINSYVDEGIPDLRYGVQDAQLMYEALTGAEGGFPATNVILMTDEQEDRLLRPGRSAIIRSLSQGLSKAAPQDLVLVYFAGHAVESEGSTSLLTSDTMLSAMALTGLPLEMVKLLMEKCGAKTRVLVVDSCHSGAANALGAMESAAAQSLFEGAEGFLVLSSCDQHEQSFEWAEKGHGAFTWFLAEGLRGRADADGDQLVTTGELASYARDATRRWAAGRGLVQTPRSVSSLPHEVVMARVEGRLPPPGVDPWETEGRLGQEITGPDGGQYVWVPPGEFEMGSKDAVDTTPHPVWISRGFWLSKCEVTCAQYYEFCCGTRRSFPFQGSSGPNHPVVMVSWWDAHASTTTCSCRRRRSGNTPRVDRKKVSTRGGTSGTPRCAATPAIRGPELGCTRWAASLPARAGAERSTSPAMCGSGVGTGMMPATTGTPR